MLQHYSDDGVFIRSMASRNASGGLSLASSEAADVLDSFGFDFIIFETLGVGQVEVDVINEADTVLVVLVPESGDDIQMMKSGLIEIADLYIINKSDRQGADRLEVALKNMLDTNPGSKIDNWKIPVLKTNAVKGNGIKELMDFIGSHFQYLKDEGNLTKKVNDRYIKQVKSTIHNYYDTKLWSQKSKIKVLEDQLSKPIQDRKSPSDLAEIILKDK